MRTYNEGLAVLSQTEMEEAILKYLGLRARKGVSFDFEVNGIVSADSLEAKIKISLDDPAYDGPV